MLLKTKRQTDDIGNMERMVFRSVSRFYLCCIPLLISMPVLASSSAVDESGYVEATLDVNSAWQGGFCAGITVTNHHPETAVGDWSVVMDIASSTLTQYWGSNFSETTGQISITPENWNMSIPAGQMMTIGFCGSRSNGEADPSLVAVTSDLSQESVNLLKNGDFESVTNGMPDHWGTKSYGSAVMSWEPDCGRGGSACVRISATNTDSSWVQTIQGLTPFKSYIIQGYAKGKGVRRIEKPGEDGTAVNLSFHGYNERPLPGGAETDGDFDWKEFKYDVMVDASGELTAAARLGFTWSMAGGDVWFDDIEVIENPDVRTHVGRHTAFTVWKNDTVNMSDAQLARWVDHMDDAYEAMQELTGYTPRQGKIVGFYWRKWAQGGGLCWASDPISCNYGDSAYTREFMDKVAQEDDWGFGQVHELGHVFHEFGGESWLIEAELMANWHLYYAIDTLQGNIEEGLSLDHWEEQYNKYWLADDPSPHHDGLHYIWGLIQKETGWEPWRQLYTWLHEHPEDIPQDQWGKIHLWHDMLDSFTSVDVWDFFTEDDVALMMAEGII